ASILDFQIGSFGPLLEDTVEIGETGPVILLPKQFALQGFSTFTQGLSVSPVPESSSAILAGIAALVVLATSRRRASWANGFTEDGAAKEPADSNFAIYRRAAMGCPGFFRGAGIHRNLSGGVGALVVVVLFVAPVRAGAISGIIMFGDSLSDTGNVLKVTTETKNPITGNPIATPRPNNPWYDTGRWTNGPSNAGSKTVDPKTKDTNYGGVWHERLADKLKVKRATNSLDGGTNWSYGGATTAAGTFSALGLQNIGEQVKKFLARKDSIKDSQLFAVWGGSNDVRDAAVATGATVKSIKQAATTALANLKQAITDLAVKGAKRFLWPNLPPLDKTPEAIAKNFSDTQRDGLKQAAQQFRNEQKAAVAMIKKAQPGIRIDVLDVYGEFVKILEKPGDFGLTNVSDNIITATAFGGESFGAATNPKFADTQIDADKFLFWDQVHPTARAHDLLAMKASKSVIPEPNAGAMLVLFMLVTTAQRRRALLGA
ncbi:SGNH/GDSL hydrolase family protein, partial [Pirellulales bacterium]|nr:SGNH/GDSL hydrolase family protein [Pirellulales bacterium]